MVFPVEERAERLSSNQQVERPIGAKTRSERSIGAENPIGTPSSGWQDPVQSQQAQQSVGKHAQAIGPLRIHGTRRQSLITILQQNGTWEKARPIGKYSWPTPVKCYTTRRPSIRGTDTVPIKRHGYIKLLPCHQ